jgi:phage/conjugal plasmid C-4 type zinc finger TraR family protein
VPDDADVAAGVSELLLGHALRHRAEAAQPASAPSITCLGCGEEIPEERLAALPKCCLCVECQDDFERGMGR